ncbi:hypothetical protein S83_002795 [Arachis hypogaea]|nr:Putative poly [ADP-ribose] polymerase [Arachis hypogaea]
MMLKLLITERRRETSTTQVQTFCYDLFASPDNLQLQQGIPVISKWLIYNQFKFVASKGIKLGGIGSVRGYGKRAIGSGRSCPLPLDDGVKVRHGALGLRQLGIAATHCKLEPMVANFIKVL